MTLKIIVNFRFTQTYRVAEVVRRYEGSSTKSSYLYENCRDIKICCDLPTFWKSLGNKVPFGSKTVFLRQEVNYYMVYIAYYTELNLQICDDAFVAIYSLFGDLWAKKCLFGSKTVFPGQELHYYMVYIAYYTELNLQICDDAFVAKIVNTRLTEVYMAFFAFHERLPTSATLLYALSWFHFWSFC